MIKALNVLAHNFNFYFTALTTFTERLNRCILINKLHALFHSEQYHGWGIDKKYFEGWYYKIISADEKHAFAIIPGIAMDEEGQKQAFVQVMDGKKLTAEYHKFSASDFQPSPKKFEVNIGANLFKRNQIRLDLPDFSGELHFTNQIPWPNPWYSPGIMGPFSFVPFMQCYHGILSMDHGIKGELKVKGDKINFDDGIGYMEKDWGRSFPSAYIWMQSNHFKEKGYSIKSSVANIPWLGSSFVGCIAGVWLQDRLIQFTTYNFSKLKKCTVDRDKVELVYENRKHTLNILAHRAEATELASPILGFMDGRIEESMTSRIEVLLVDKRNKKVLLEDTGRNAGLEVAGKIEQITM